MSEPSFQDDVLNELGADRLHEVASPEPPLQGVAAFGGLVSGGLMAGVLAKPANHAVELLVPVVVAALTKRAAKRGGAGGGLGDLLDGGPKQ
ncbi:hypothetical protein [Streptomyces sp. bgisy126]|uniref:hypothetical protein n=1 Tax=unclassified Streptomyces TaxID=2593676 RepID=UPI003EB8599E